MAALVIRSLNILLGIFFTFLGTLKITPSISRDLHKDLRSEYAKFAKVLPGAKLAGVKVPSKWYRRGVGTIEIVCGEIQPGGFFGSDRSPRNANVRLPVREAQSSLKQSIFNFLGQRAIREQSESYSWGL